MDKKALIKAILCLVGFFAYLTLVVITCASNSPVFIGVVLGPVVIIGIVMTGVERGRVMYTNLIDTGSHPFY